MVNNGKNYNIKPGKAWEAWQYQNITVQAFIKGFQAMKEENWALPLMQTLILDLRNFARRGDKRAIGGNSSFAYSSVTNIIY